MQASPRKQPGLPPAPGSAPPLGRARTWGSSITRSRIFQAPELDRRRSRAALPPSISSASGPPAPASETRLTPARSRSLHYTLVNWSLKDVQTTQSPDLLSILKLSSFSLSSPSFSFFLFLNDLPLQTLFIGYKIR